MAGTIVCKYFFSPLSDEIIDALVEIDMPIGLVATVSQVGLHWPGYTGFSGPSLRKRVEGTKLKLFRDHLGRSGEDVFVAAQADSDNGWTGVHLHTWADTDLASRLLSAFPNLEWEIGPGEDRPTDELSMLRFFTGLPKAPNLKWLSFPTGCKIVEGMSNTNKVVWDRLRRMQDFGVPLRAHNCDYLWAKTLKSFIGEVQGINVAPALGVVQTLTTLRYAIELGVDVTNWQDRVMRAGHWKKWASDSARALIVTGHYCFDQIPSELRHVVRPRVIEAVKQAAMHYIGSFV